MSDATEKALFLPFTEDLPPEILKTGKTLFVNAVICEGLNMADPARLTALQWYFPDADKLSKAGYETVTGFDALPADFDNLLIRATKQHKETQYLLAAALQKLKDGGVLVCTGANDAGGKRLKKDLSSLGVNASEISKFKCRAAYGKPVRAELKADLIASMIAEAAPRLVEDTGFTAQPGLFGWNKIDAGSALLTEYIPQDIKGRVADFGCGYGYLSAFILNNCPKVKHLSCIDADARAVKTCQANTAELHTETPRFYLWDDATAISKLRGGEAVFDHIIMNPPFHQDKNLQYDLGCAFISSAAKHLRKKAHLWMVANNHLPYEEHLNKEFFSVEKLAETKGFKIIHAAK